MSIPCSALLDPISLSHYTTALSQNLSSDSGKTLSLRKLKQLKQSHLSHMGISDFDDQKAIMKAVKSALVVKPQAEKR